MIIPVHYNIYLSTHLPHNHHHHI